MKQELADAKADIKKLEDSAYGEMLLGEAEEEEEAGRESSGWGLLWGWDVGRRCQETKVSCEWQTWDSRQMAATWLTVLTGLVTVV